MVVRKYYVYRGRSYGNFNGFGCSGKRSLSWKRKWIYVVIFLMGIRVFKFEFGLEVR